MGSTRHIFVAAAIAGTLALGCLSCRQSFSDTAVGGTVAGLNLDQATGQLMMVGFKGPKLTPAIRDTLRNLHPGGICLYAQNITGAEQVAKLNDELRVFLDEALPPFVAVDQEGGMVVRIYDEVTVFPSSMALGATRSTDLAAEAGTTIGRELRLLGFNMNLAPVLDPPDNLAIGSRAFSDDPRIIADLGTAFITGQQQVGVATVAKHFPGEGHSYGDSHYQLPVRWEAAATIRAELAPFCEAINNDLDAVMTAHVAVPALAKNRSPATVSGKLLTGVLRQELGFDGLVLTDELEGMRAISEHGVDRAAVAAINAGADMVFVAFSPDTQQQVHRALLQAVRSGRIPRWRLEQAIGRIVALKTKRHVFDDIAPVSERLSLLHLKTGEHVARQIAQESVTQLGPQVDCLPILPNRAVSLITDSQNFESAIRTRAPQIKVLQVDGKALRNTRSTKRAIQEVIAGAEIVIAAFTLQDRFQIVAECVSPSRPLVLVFMNVPGRNFLRVVPKAQAILVNYSYQPVSADAVADVLFHDAATPGIAPVKVEYEQWSTRTASGR